MKQIVLLATLSGALLAAAALVSGCKSNPANDPSQQQNPYGQQGYPPNGQQPYGSQPYATGAPPPATAPAATGLPPSPLAPACQQLEGTCGFARCNLQAGRCAFPCNSNNDCINGSSCLGAGTPIAVCTPAMGGVPGQ
jgi:hypothetical protein